MKKIKSFLKTTIIGGLVVILPATIVVTVFRWLYVLITDWIQPLTDVLVERASLREFLADLVVISSIIGVCFLLGLVVRTGVGRFVHQKLEGKLARFAPGYKLVKETVLQFLGRKKSPFSQVALVKLYDSNTRATAFVTDEHPDGTFTVFVPTGPNPTSGQIFHLEAAKVEPLDVGVEHAMRTIISCGAGTSGLIPGAHEPTGIDPA
jgi:uncharacterized membrane protein